MKFRLGDASVWAMGVTLSVLPLARGGEAAAGGTLPPNSDGFDFQPLPRALALPVYQPPSSVYTTAQLGSAPADSPPAASTLVVPVYKPPAEPVPLYRPPLRGAPAVRMDAGSRGDDAGVPRLSFLSPDHVGLTTKEQPTLFWYQSKPSNMKFEMTIMEAKGVSPILAVKIDNTTKAGIQRLRLSDYGVKLAVGVDYRCTLALVLDEENRSLDVIASGVVRRIQPTAKVAGRLAKASQTDLPFIYAEEGIWYDAIESLGDLIDAHPDNKAFYTQRAALLQQVRLSDAAASDIKLASAR